MRWYVERNGKIRGPFAKDALREMVAIGEIDASCRLRSVTDASDTWRSLEEVPEIGAPRAISSILPPLPPSSEQTVPIARQHIDRTTINVERAEKFGRMLLWLALAATIVMVPLGLARERKTEADTLARIKDATRASEEKFAALQQATSDKALRIPLDSIGNGLTSLNTTNATGQLWFTNVSPRAGHVCVVGEATNLSTHGVTRSLPACAEVPAYASAVHMTVSFANDDLTNNCKPGCALRFTDAIGAKL